MNYKIYIDSANLHKSSNNLEYELDYKKLRIWLSQKYETKDIVLYMGLIPGKENMYNYLINECGYKIIFKETINFKGEVKGNCDGELILDAVRDYYENENRKYIFITGDGDFACLFRFLFEKECDIIILAPKLEKCSYLIKKIYGLSIVFLDTYYNRFKSNRKSK